MTFTKDLSLAEMSRLLLCALSARIGFLLPLFSSNPFYVHTPSFQAALAKVWDVGGPAAPTGTAARTAAGHATPRSRTETLRGLFLDY